MGLRLGLVSLHLQANCELKAATIVATVATLAQQLRSPEVSPVMTLSVRFPDSSQLLANDLGSTESAAYGLIACQKKNRKLGSSQERKKKKNQSEESKENEEEETLWEPAAWQAMC